jgi:hypothetical protein
MRSLRPRARTTRLVTRKLGDELLVYDLDRHRVYCLNQLATQVFRHCDGKTTLPDIARRVGDVLRIPVGEQAVRLGLLRLEKARLLEESVSGAFNTSRRDLLRNLGRAAVVAVPVVTALSVPTAAQAASCGCRVMTFFPCGGCQAGASCGDTCSRTCKPGLGGALFCLP